MKRIAMVLVLAVAGLPAFAERFFVLGVDAGYTLQDVSFFYEGSSYDILANTIRAGVFADTRYLRASIGYAFTPSKPLSVMIDGVESAGGLPDDFWTMWIVDVRLLARLPFATAFGGVWPAVGLAWEWGMDFNTNYNPDPVTNISIFEIFLVGGVGADIQLTRSVVLTTEVMATYDLLSTQGWAYSSFSWIDVSFRIGAGVRL